MAKKFFGLIILVTDSRGMLLSEFLAHLLGPLPWPHANGDGSVRKGNTTALYILKPAGGKP